MNSNLTSNTSSAIAGYGDPVTDFKYAERSLSGSMVQNNFIDLFIPVGLTDHRLHGYISAVQTAAGQDSWVRCELALIRGGAVLSLVPFVLAITTAAGAARQSFFSALTASNTPQMNALALVLWQPGATDTVGTVYLQPFEFHGTIDEIQVNCKEAVNVTSFRAVVACVSSL